MAYAAQLVNLTGIQQSFILVYSATLQETLVLPPQGSVSLTQTQFFIATNTNFDPTIFQLIVGGEPIPPPPPPPPAGSQILLNGAGIVIPAFSMTAFMINGTIGPSSCSDSTTWNFAGVTNASIAIGGYGAALKVGTIPGAAAGLVGAAYGQEVFLGIGGALSLTAPTDPSQAVVRIGRAVPASGGIPAGATDLILEFEIISLGS